VIISRNVSERVLDRTPRGRGHVDAPCQRDPIESNSAADRIRAHVLEREKLADLQLWNVALLDDKVQAVARRPPDARLDERLSVQALVAHEDRLYYTVVVEQAVEGGVDAVVDVVHVGS